MTVLTDLRNNKRAHGIALNLLFWALLAFVISYGISTTREMEERTWGSLFMQGFLGMSLLLMPVVYFNTLVLVPRFFVKKRYWQYVLSVLVVAFVWPPLPIYLDNIIDTRFFGATPEDLDNPLDEKAGFVMLLVISISTLVKMTFRSIQQQGKVDKIENERLVMELSMLRNQISPHFFFNTLNNLYALSLEESKETPKVILKLSEMMRYTIYECNGPQVPLSSEVKYLENYIDLQQMRHHKKVQIDFEKSLDYKEAEICPLALIVFLENAFKHGVDGVEGDAFVKMRLTANQELISFQIQNSIVTGRQSTNGGIGLENARKRLDLIYGKDYTLDVREENGIFSVDLNIKLS